MQWIIGLISLVWVVFGCLAILYTSQTRAFAGNYIPRMGRIPAGALAAVIGVLLVVAARGSVQAGIIGTLGMLALIKGIIIIWNPKGVYEQILQWYLVQASDQTYRFWGIVALVLGTALFSWA